MTETVTTQVNGREIKLYRTETVASFGEDGESRAIWIDGLEFPNVYVEDGSGGFVQISEDSVDHFSVVSGDHYRFLVTNTGDVAYIDRDAERGAYVTGGVAYRYLSEAMTAARSPQSARNRADVKYRRDKVTRIELKLYPSEDDLLQWLDRQGPRSTYIKRLIREDMERNSRD